MKKSYLALAAAALVMAGCSNEVLIDDIKSGDNDVVIGFSTFSDKATKAATTSDLEYYHGTFSVYGSKKSTVDDALSYIFEADEITFSENATTPNEWTYSPYRFWDKQANYNFIAVAPSSDIVKYNTDKNKEVGDASYDFVTVDGGYTLKGQNLQATATSAEKVAGFKGGTGEDTDIMTSANVPQTGSTVNNQTIVNLTFKHILAKLNVTVAKAEVLNDADVKVNSIVISGLDNKGEYAEKSYKTVEYVAATGTYVAGTKYYTDNTGSSEVDVTGFEGTTSVTSYFVAKESKTSGWSSTSAAQVNSSDYVLKYQAATNATDNELADATSSSVTVPTYFIESLVMPQGLTASDATATPAVVGEKVTVKYSITTKDASNNEYTENFTYQMDLKNAFADGFFDRCNYTLNFTISPLTIKFDATATVWDDQTAVDKTIY